MKNANSEFFTYVQVEPVLREFYLCVNKGSDILRPTKHDVLWKVVKANLECVPLDVIPVPANHDTYLRIVILYTREFRREYRHYLSEKGQQAICSHLNSLFKDVFHNYVFGAISAGRCTQIDAIRMFMNDYNISADSIKFETLQKSWQRSQLYASWKEKKCVCLF